MDADGLDDLVAWNPTTGIFKTRILSSGQEEEFQLGLSTDIPIVADFFGDSRCERAVFRPSTGRWYIERNASVGFGTTGDVPLALDVNGNGKAQLTVYRPSETNWWVKDLGGRQFGLPAGFSDSLLC